MSGFYYNHMLQHITFNIVFAIFKIAYKSRHERLKKGAIFLINIILICTEISSVYRR